MSNVGLQLNTNADNSSPVIMLLDNSQNISSQYGSLGIGYHTPDISPRHGRAPKRDVTPILFTIDLNSDDTDLTNRKVAVEEAQTGWIRSGMSWLAETFLCCCTISEPKADPSQVLEVASAAYLKALQSSDDRGAACKSALDAAYQVVYPAAYEACMTAYQQATTSAALYDMGLLPLSTPVIREAHASADTPVNVAYSAAINVINIARNTADDYARNNLEESIQDLHILTATYTALDKTISDISIKLFNISKT